MSGFEGIGAILGIADVSFRCISALYSALSDLQDVPKEIRSLRNEIAVLQQCLEQLKFLEKADDNTRAIVATLGLPAAVQDCAQACEDLLEHISFWIASPRQNIFARIRFLVNRNKIQSVLDNIRTTKQTTILTVVVTSLVIQLREPLSPRERLSLIDQGEAQIREITSATMSSSGSRRGRVNEDHKKGYSLKVDDRPDQALELRRVDNTTTNRRQTPVVVSMAKSAWEKVTQIWHKEVEVTGGSNEVGIDRKNDNKDYDQTWMEKVKVTGTNKKGVNKVGIYQS